MPILLSTAAGGHVVLRLPDPQRVSLADCERAERLAHDWVVMARHAGAVEEFNEWIAAGPAQPLAAVAWLLSACAQILEAATGQSAVDTINELAHSGRWQTVRTADISSLDAKLTDVVRLGALATLVADDAVGERYDEMADASDAAPRLVINQALMIFDTLVRQLLAASVPPWGFTAALAATPNGSDEVVELTLASWGGGAAAPS